MRPVLVTGGAGYIGSHIVRRLCEQGRPVVVLDNLAEGHREALPPEVPVLVGDIGDPSILAKAFEDHRCRWVIHMAASSLVGESVEHPAAYYDNNVRRTLVLLEEVRRREAGGVVFSSTAAVYGEPERTPIPEDHPKHPTNPYGETKLAIERALHWFHRAYHLPSVALRYFNAAGAHPSGEIGEDHEPETHLIPRLLRTVGRDVEPTPIFGRDYPTRDGTCVRDYVHVMDLAEAHILALEAMERGRLGHDVFNLGNGTGFSVLEVLDAVAEVTGTRPEIVDAPRRPGDPATLVASSEKARRLLGWRPQYPELRRIIETAWAWHRAHPLGYSPAPGAR